MRRRRPSEYRDALQVSPERIAAMSDNDLNILMGQLLRAQAYRCGSPPNEIRVNTEDKASDEGSDGWSTKPKREDEWLGSTDTCWQFKAGSAGTPARLVGEVTKHIPKDTLTRGGRFVVVASGSKSGKKGEKKRLEKLTTDAAAAAIPTGNIEVIGSERLTTWCNQHPAIAACWAGRPDGLWSLGDWSNSDEHQVPWQASDTVQSELNARRSDLDFSTGRIHHLHIQGPPGVGKTRFALELCRGATWRDAVIYLPQAADFRLEQLIDGAAADTGVQFIVVADEVQYDQLQPLRDSVSRCGGRVRLMTIGHSGTPDPIRIPALFVKPLDPPVMHQVIAGWYPAMPREHIDFVVRFADGYVRLAKLAASAVIQAPKIDIRGLLNRDEIRGFLDGMLGTGDRLALYVVAVLSRVGWTEDKQDEGMAVALHFGLNWNRVRADVEAFHRRLGIAPRGGRYRYISPVPLGIHLAVEAWTTFPDLLKSLPDVLPSDEARDAYFERLQSIASNPQAGKFAREELAFFFHLSDFVDARAVRRWSALSSADPPKAAKNILQALTSASVEERTRIADVARREAVSTLVRIAWKQSSFHDAIKALALLAEAENETWSNNASAEFVARFQIFLGGTAVSYCDRLPVLDELLAEERPALGRLVVKALAQVGKQQVSRAWGPPASDELPEKEWRPSTEREYLECEEHAVKKLIELANRGIAELQADLVDAANKLSMLLYNSDVRDAIATYFHSVHEAYPEAREPLRRIIADVIHRDRKYWKKLPEEELKVLETLHTRFEDSSLGARLQQHIGPESWGQEEAKDLRQLAEEILSTPRALLDHWSWLTSGNASDGWRLGEALAEVDTKGELAETLPSLPGGGRDMRLLCAYVSARRKIRGDTWYEGWVATQFDRVPRPVALLFEVAWRCGATESIASIVATILRREHVSPHIVGQLGIGRWGENITFDALEKVLQAMAETGHRATAIAILEHRMKNNPTEVYRWKPLALELVTASELIRSEQMVEYYWGEVAMAIVSGHAGEISAAILREQADRESGSWFAEFSVAAKVLHACVEQDPRAVWQALQLQLSVPNNVSAFSIGFPRGILERVPADEITAWIAEKPEERTAMTARFTSKDMSTDNMLASRIIGEYGDKEDVASAFFSEYLTGSWSGPSSAHWDQLAESLEEVARRTTLPKLRRWAADSARSLRGMAERDRHREEEEFR
jgi:hypothetical protein